MEGETKKEVEMQETKIEVGNKDQQVSGKEVDNTPNPDGQKIKRKMLLTPAWDYVMMFADVDVPKEKDQPVPESSGKYKKWTKVREERTAILNALRLPTAGLTISAKKTGGRMYILIAATEERLFHEAERIHLSVPLKSEYGGGYDDFDLRKKRFYEPAAPVRGETEAPSFFRRLQRMQLIDSIICSRVEDGGCNLVVPKLLKNGIINKYYGLHDEEERSSLMRHWVWRNIIKTQDIDRVRNYFGEEIAFYFAWLEFKTSRLTAAMALGLVVTALWIAGKLTDNGDLEVWPLTLYSVYLGVWAALFQNYWARRESTLAFKWGVTELEDVETLRPEYFGDDKEGLYFNGEWIEFGGEETDKISAALTEIITGENPNKTNEEAEKQTGGTRPMAVKLNVERQPYYSAIKRNLKILLSLPILGVIVLVMVITTIAVLTLRLFLQRAIGKIDDRLTIIGSIVGGIANAVCIILLNQVYQRLALRLTLWENYRTYSQFNNQLTVKMFFFQFVNSYLSLYYLAFFKNGTRLWGSDDPDVWDTCKQGSDSPNIIGWGCIDEVSTQIGTLMITAMTIGNIKQVVLPWLLGMIRAKLYARKQVEEKTLQQYEKESNLQDWPGVFDEYNEMAIQYGFITLFAAAFPLAPLLGWVNCAIQLRSDAFKLLEAFGKPHFRTAAGIGTWRMIFEFVGVAAIITNCALICFAYPTLLSAIQRSMGVSPSADLAWRAAFATFGICVILEHVLILSKYLIDVLIPDVPGSVRKAMAKAEYLKEETFKTLNPEKISSDWKAKTIKNGTNEEQLSNETF